MIKIVFALAYLKKNFLSLNSLQLTSKFLNTAFSKIFFGQKYLKCFIGGFKPFIVV